MKNKLDSVEDVDALAKYLPSATLSNSVRNGRGGYVSILLTFRRKKKDFDSIHRDGLWRILRACGISTEIVNIFRNFYSTVHAALTKVTDF